MATKEIRASHILVGDKKQAEELCQKCKAGADFAYMAEKYSKCPSAKKGGDLGMFGKGQMVPQFERAAFALNIGEVSDVVPTQFGFHVIKRTA